MHLVLQDKIFHFLISCLKFELDVISHDRKHLYVNSLITLFLNKILCVWRIYFKSLFDFSKLRIKNKAIIK